MSYRIINGRAYPVGNFGQITSKPKQVSNKVESDDKTSFQNLFEKLKSKDEGFTVSKHAALRLNEINFTEDDMKQIEKGFEIAKDKNSKNTVMLYKDVALIASVENKTLITAVERERAKDNIFTNIDSVVLL
ncbi:TIGR02530 family flagellar biosynthesis protein [uncultured Clostridium sp.]|uniref:TIGR02530 family flagellar biosynthesis protein n=1 Tax=uncultured Clostridium sp. TaxID=59620 RepID=UPI0028E23A6E|nr:TIGR02530 family flagellar biosynthesis protein [uncultured Clostridium sp.]